MEPYRRPFLGGWAGAPATNLNDHRCHYLQDAADRPAGQGRAPVADHPWLLGGLILTLLPGLLFVSSGLRLVDDWRA